MTQPLPTPQPAGGVALVVLAAGSGTRLGAEVNKVFLPLAGRRVLTWSLDATEHLPGLASTTVVLRDEDRGHADAVLQEVPGRAMQLVRGGATRHASEVAALRALEPDIRAGLVDVVLLHDAARPLASPALFARIAGAARRWGGALPVLDQPGVLAVRGQPPSGRLVTVQTPQAFRALPLLDAYERAEHEGFAGSDTSACVERFGDLQVRAVPGEPGNIKVTFSEDLLLAERLLAMRQATHR